MAQERLAPDALLSGTLNLTGTVSAIQDDPDSPDGNWLTSSGGGNTNTDCHASFPTPSGNLSTSANAQEFRILVRKTNHPTDPTVRVFLYVNGVQNSELGSATAVSSTTGTVLSRTWTASGITASQVEIFVDGVTGGGNPGNRASVEVGAIEWNAEVTVATNASGGTSTATGTSNPPVSRVGVTTLTAG